MFLGAGFETTSNTLTTLCLNLAKHPQVLDSLLEEVDEVIERFDGVVNHETINDMPYLDACIKVRSIFEVFIIKDCALSSLGEPKTEWPSC